MKKIRKTIAAFTALTMAMSINVISANASSTFLKGDVNNNNAVDLTDLTSMAIYLSGGTSIDDSTAERMDVDSNKVIDVNDQNAILSIVMHNDVASTDTYANDTDMPLQETRGYYKYSPTNGNCFGYYILSPMNNTISTNTRGIIGDDTRVLEEGLQGVLNVQSSSGGNVGTAFVVDEHTILTAAHVLCNYQSKNVQKNLKFKIFDSNNNATNIQITPITYHIPSNYVDQDYYDGGRLYDYAIVTTSEDLSDYINFSLGTMRCGSSIGNSSVYVTGFGGSGVAGRDDNINSNLAYKKSTGSGHLVSPEESESDYMIRYDVDIVKGDSGGPIYITNGNIKTVIGIHTFESYVTENGVERNINNGGIKLTTDILHFIYNNNHLNIDN